MLGTKKVRDFLLPLLSLHLLQEACVGYKVKEFLEGSLCWISWIAYVEERRTHTDTDRPRERERAGGKAQMRTHSYRRQMMLEHAVSLLGVLAFTSISLAIVDWPDTPAYVPLCLHVHSMDHSSSLKLNNLLLLPS